MIKSASELLSAFMASERQEVEAISMDHMPTLGAAYEAIVSSGLDARFVLPPGLDLRVVGGFIEGLKNQIDCMLVCGDGQRYGKTNQYIYPIDQVLCVLEVKKTLLKAELVDGIGHLADVQRHFLRHFVDRYSAGEIQEFGQARESFSKLTGRPSPTTARELDAAPVEDRLLFSTLARQMYAPMTVLLGFGGYQTERGLREALTDVIEADVGGESNSAIELLPSLISVGNYSLLKCTGQPYLAVEGDDRWVAIASTRHNPALILLEFLWTKIERFCNVRMPFGPVLEIETLESVVTAKGVQRDNREGWLLRSSEKDEQRLKQRPASVRWEPVKLSSGAICVAGLLVAGGGALDLDGNLRAYIRRAHGEDVDLVVAELVRTSAFRLRGRQLQAIPPVAFIATLPDGSGYAGPNREPLERWCKEQGLAATFMNIVSMS